MADETFKPSESLINSLASGPTTRMADELPQIAGYVPTAHEPQLVHVTENKRIALKHIKDTLGYLTKAMGELSELAPASQKGFFYQQIALVAKTMLEGAHLLHELDPDTPPEARRKGPTNQHLHLNLTSAQMNDLIQAQIRQAAKPNQDD